MGCARRSQVGAALPSDEGACVSASTTCASGDTNETVGSLAHIAARWVRVDHSGGATVLGDVQHEEGANVTRLKPSLSVTGAFVVLALPVSVPGAAGYQPTATAGPVVTAVFSGHFETTWPTAVSTTDPKGIPGDVATAKLDWKATVDETTEQLSNGVEAHWRYKQLFGTYDYTLLPHAGDPTTTKCQEVLQAVPGFEKSDYSTAELTYVPPFGRKPALYEVTASVPFNVESVTTGLDPNDPCAAFAYWPEPPTNDKGAGLLTTMTMELATTPGHSPTKSFGGAWKDPNEDASDNVSAVLSISVPEH